MSDQTSSAAPDALRSEAASRGQAATSALDGRGLSAAGALILRAIDALVHAREGAAFLLRRVEREMSTLEDPGESRHLSGVLSALAPCRDPNHSDSAPEFAGAALPDALVIWAGHLEQVARLEGAARVLSAAMELDPGDAEIKLHAARVARRDGDSRSAISLYRAVRDGDGRDGHLGRMAEVGLALLESDARRALGRVLRRAVRDGDGEAAAVAHEERARLRRRDGDRNGALRDYAAACVRFAHSADRGRVAHSAADLLMASGDPLAAREVLLEVERLGVPAQVERARSRLREVSRTIGDDLGRRRWSGAGSGGLVSLASGSRVPDDRSLRPRVRRAVRRLGRRKRVGTGSGRR